MRRPARPSRSRLILAAPLGAALLLLYSVSLALAQGVGQFITTYPGGARPTCASIPSPVTGKTYCYDAAEVVGGNPQNALKVYTGSGYSIVGGGSGGSPAGSVGSVQVNAGAGAFGSTTALTDVTALGAVCNGSDIGSTMASALAGTAQEIYQPSGCVWTSSRTLPAEKSILGAGYGSVIGDGGSFLTIASRGRLANLRIRDANTGVGAEGYLGLGIFYGLSAQSYTLTGQDIAVDVWKAGATGTGTSVGISVNHLGLGSGDNYYGQITAGATEFFDAAFRADSYGGAAGAALYSGFLFDTASTSMRAHSVIDKRGAINSSFPPLFYSWEAVTGTVPLLYMEQKGAAFGGTFLSLQAAAGSGSFSGSFITAGSGGTTVWSVSAAGVTTTKDLILYEAGGARGSIQFYDNGNTNFVGIKAPSAIGTNLVWEWPAVDGANGDCLATNGAAALSFIPCGGGGAGTITAIGGQAGPVITVNGAPHANLSIAAAANDLSIAQTGAFGAALGGTGQSSFTKGDLLCASAATTLTKLGVGTDGQILTADSTQACGVKWGSSAGTGTVTNTGTLMPNAFILGNGGVDVKPQAITGYVKGAGASAPSGVTTIPVTDGGTNITSYTKGDLLVATGATTLVKVPVGLDGQCFIADSTQASGVKYTGCASGGSVTSVGLAAPGGGVFSVTGSPVTAAGTLTLVATGTSGGLPYFASTSTIASSAALTNRGLLVGGGAGAAPRAIAAMANGQFPIGSTGADPVPGTLGSSTLTIAQGAGTLTADIPSPLKIAIQDKGGEQFDIAAYGAVPNSSGAAAANTAAWNAAKTAAAAAGGGIIYVPQGRWYLNVVADIPTNVSIRCSGQSTQLEFVPTADNQTFLHFNTAKDSGIRDCVIFSEELTFTKTAIKITNNDNFYADGVTIGYQGNNWTGAGSIGWDIGGHFLVKITRPDTYADRPMIFRGVAAAGYGCDFCYIGHGQLDANNSAHPTIEVLDTAVLSQTVIEDMSLHRGSGWFTHIGPTNLSGGGPGALVFRDIRAEQPVDENDWCFNIDVPSPLHGLQIQFENVRCPNKNGIRLRRVEEVTLNGFFQSTASGTYTTSIDASAAGAFTGDIVIVNLITGATPVMTGYRLDFDALRGFQLWRSATATTAPTAQFSSVSTSGCVLGNGFFSCGAGGAVPAGPSKLAFSQPTSTIGVISVHGPGVGLANLGVMQFTLLDSTDSTQLNPLVLSSTGARISLNASSPLPTPAGVLQVAAATGTQTGIVAEGFNAQGAFIGRRASGSPTARGPLLSGEAIVALYGSGAYDATSYSGAQGSFGCFAGQNWSASSLGTFCTVGVTPLGSTTLTESMRWAGISGGQGYRVSMSPTNAAPSYANSRPFAINATTSGSRTASGPLVEGNPIAGMHVKNTDASTPGGSCGGGAVLGLCTSVTNLTEVQETSGFGGTAYGLGSIYYVNGSTYAAERAALFAGAIATAGSNFALYGANHFMAIEPGVTNFNLVIGSLTEVWCGKASDCLAKATGIQVQAGDPGYGQTMQTGVKVISELVAGGSGTGAQGFAHAFSLENAAGTRQYDLQGNGFVRMTPAALNNPSFATSRPFNIDVSTTGTRAATGSDFVTANSISGFYVKNTDASQSASLQLGDRTSVTGFVHATETSAFTGTAYGLVSLYEINGSTSAGERAATFSGTFVNSGSNAPTYGHNVFLGVKAAVSSIGPSAVALAELNCQIAGCLTNAFGASIANVTSAFGTSQKAAAGLIIHPTLTIGGGGTDAWGQAIRYGNYNGTDTRFQVRGAGDLVVDAPAGYVGTLLSLNLNAASVLAVNSNGTIFMSPAAWTSGTVKTLCIDDATGQVFKKTGAC